MYGIGLTGGVGNTEVTMLQCVESVNSAIFYGKSAMTFSVKVYSPVAKNIVLFIDTANATDVFSATTERANTTFAHPGGVWSTIILTYPLPHADIIKGVRVRINLGACTSGVYYIAGAQLEEGSVATPFEARPYSMELALCQRYYYRITAANGLPFATAFSVVTNGTARAISRFPVSMRVAPSAIEQNGTAGDYSLFFANTITGCTSVPSFSAATTDYAQTVFTTTSGHTAGQSGSAACNKAGGNYLGWSAEL
jgi:hypothetical protein